MEPNATHALLVGSFKKMALAEVSFNTSRFSCVKIFCILVGVELFNPTLARDNLVATFPTMGPQFILKINLTINSWDSGWRHILQVTDGGRHSSTGDRYPFLALNNEKIVFVSEKNGNFNPDDLKYEAELNTKYKIEVHQTNMDGTTMFKIFIDDVEEVSVINSSPIVVENALVYLAPNFVDAGNATVEYFYLESFYCDPGFYWNEGTSSCESNNL